MAGAQDRCLSASHFGTVFHFGFAQSVVREEIQAICGLRGVWQSSCKINCRDVRAGFDGKGLSPPRNPTPTDQPLFALLVLPRKTFLTTLFPGPDAGGPYFEHPGAKVLPNSRSISVRGDEDRALLRRHGKTFHSAKFSPSGKKRR
jgi:hypothetical protein